MEIKTKITGVQHAGIPTNDIGKSMQFYRGLGFEPVWQTVNPDNGRSRGFPATGKSGDGRFTRIGRR